MSDNEHYQVIAEELKTNNVDSVLWLRAKALAEGDRDKTEAAYIRLRFADLKKQKLLPQAAFLDGHGSELSRLRSELAKRSLAQGKKSLYSTLGLTPDASDSIIAATIADIESRDPDHSNISIAEFKYAKETLGNPELRERYDRQLMNSLSAAATRSYVSSYDGNDYEESWWNSRKTSAIIGVLSVVLLGYLGLGYWKEKHTSNLQNDIVDLEKEKTHNVTDIEQVKTQADIALRERMMSLQEERQQQELEMRARTTDQMLEQQRQMQEAEQKRQQMLKEQAENQRVARERQYYACLNQQLGIQLSQRNGSSYDAYARCAMYPH